jgi:hypothetical protein
MPDPNSFPQAAPPLELGPDDILRVPERCPHNAPARIAKTVRDGEDEPKRWRTIVDYACSQGCHVIHIGPMWPEVVRTQDTNRRLAILG